MVAEPVWMRERIVTCSMRKAAAKARSLFVHEYSAAWLGQVGEDEKEKGRQQSGWDAVMSLVQTLQTAAFRPRRDIEK